MEEFFTSLALTNILLMSIFIFLIFGNYSSLPARYQLEELKAKLDEIKSILETKLIDR